MEEYKYIQNVVFAEDCIIKRLSKSRISYTVDNVEFSYEYDYIFMNVPLIIESEDI